MRDYFMRTARLGFGRWTPDDLEIAAGLWGDPRVTRLIGGPFSMAWVESRLALEIANERSLGISYWPIFRLADGAPLGCCGLRPVAGRTDVFELGFHLRPEHWGQGYARESAAAVVDHAFDRLAAVALVAGHHPENAASRHVLERLGFRFAGAELYPPTGLEHPSYELTREAFDRLRASAPR